MAGDPFSGASGGEPLPCCCLSIYIRPPTSIASYELHHTHGKLCTHYQKSRGHRTPIALSQSEQLQCLPGPARPPIRGSPSPNWTRSSGPSGGVPSSTTTRIRYSSPRRSPSTPCCPSPPRPQTMPSMPRRPVSRTSAASSSWPTSSTARRRGRRLWLLSSSDASRAMMTGSVSVLTGLRRS